MANTTRKKARKTSKNKTDSRKTTAGKSATKSLWDETVATLMAIFGIFLLLSLYSEIDTSAGGGARANMMGLVGSEISQILLSIFGWCSFVSVFWCFLLSYAIWTRASRSDSKHSYFGFLSLTATAILLMSSASIFAVFWGFEGGGWLGSKIAYKAIEYLNRGGAVLLSFSVFFVALGVATGLRTSSFLRILTSFKNFFGEYVVDAGFVLKESLFNLFHLINFIMRGALNALLALCKLLAQLGYQVARYFFHGLSGLSDTVSEIEQSTESEAPKSRSEGFVLGNAKELSFAKRATATSKAQDTPSLEIISETVQNPIILRKFPSEDEEANIPKPKPAYKLKSKTEKPSLFSSKRKTKTTDYSDYDVPSLDILVSGEASPSCAPDDAELIENSKRLEVSLENFKIGGRVSEVHPGPVVTLYQFEPAAGVKVQRIINLADDLALSLKVGNVRVFAPVPGKGTVGIEVPNAHREMVRLRDVLEGDDYQQSDVPLLLGLGKDTYGEPYVADLSKMPHLLIAGATGTGKSVCINSLLLSLLCRNSPETLRLLLIDPKMLELSTYEEIPHLNAPVVTQPKRARGVLWWAVEEMERRYELMKNLGVRNIAMYNRAITSGSTKGTKLGRKKRKTGVVVLEEKDVVATAGPYEGLDRSLDANMEEAEAQALMDAEPLPRIVIVVDELADLMLTVGREIEELLTRLAQKARASGIHLILATQRPSVNVITGLIKANFPARISFKVASKIDARTVMDTSGAEKLLGQGDMLFMSPGAGRIMRLHSPFVSDKEVHDIVEEIRTQGEPDYDEAIEKMISKIEESESSSSGGLGGDDEYDEFYDKAVALVVDKGQASTSMVQRAFRIGYNRAARILETMERDGVVGPADGSRPRQVLVGSIE